jgi:hypothetical protein
MEYHPEKKMTGNCIIARVEKMTGNCIIARVAQ